MTLALLIAGAVLAFLLGIWLGLPGRYRSAEEIEELMAQGPRRRQRVRRRFVAVAWLQRQISGRSMHRDRGFGLRAPDDRD